MDAAGFLIVAIEACYIRAIIEFTEIRINGVNELCRVRCMMLVMMIHISRQP